MCETSSTPAIIDYLSKRNESKCNGERAMYDLRRKEIDLMQDLAQNAPSEMPGRVASTLKQYENIGLNLNETASTHANVDNLSEQRTSQHIWSDLEEVEFHIE